MIDNWLDACLELAATPAEFYAGGNRKIFRERFFTFKKIRNDLNMGDCGYTKSKLSMLKRLYQQEESLEIAVELWAKRCGQNRYGSVGFTCYNHFVKGGSIDAKRSKRASVFGPCIQSITLTYLEKPSRTKVDVYYRTTEIFKKFPADLVFIRDELLSRFDFSTAPLESISFYFSNITCHPMYFVTLIPLMGNPIKELETIRIKDERFFLWLIKGTSRYLIPKYHRGIEKFAQAMRVSKDANERIEDRMKTRLVDYLEEHHPGFSREYSNQELEEDEVPDL